jgi:hypothetical protein
MKTDPQKMSYDFKTHEDTKSFEFLLILNKNLSQLNLFYPILQMTVSKSIDLAK